MNIYFASNCRYLRRIHNLRQEDVARELRISHQAYCYYERRKGYLHHTIVTMVASFFHVSIQDLMYTDLKRDPHTMQYFLISVGNKLTVIDSIELEALTIRLADLEKELALLMAPQHPVSIHATSPQPNGKPTHAPVGRHPDPVPFQNRFLNPLNNQHPCK